MILNCVLNVWSPSIGDPHLMGWVTVVSYFLVATLAYFVLRQTGEHTIAARPKTNQHLWMLVLVLLILLGANKQLDLQSFFTATAKCISKIDGWYANRRIYQIGFIAVLAISFLILSVVGLRYFKNDLKRNPLAIVGVILLLFFVVLRAASFHHIDAVANHHFFDLNMNWILELPGLGLIALQAILNLTARSR